MKQRRFWCHLSLLGGLAFGIRLLNVWYVVRALGTAQILDAAYYHDVALALLGRQSAVESDVAFSNLGYPHVVSWLYAVHPSPTTVLVAQALFGGVTAMLTGLVARDLFEKERVGLWAAGLLAVYAPSIFYDGLLLISSFSAFATALLAYSLGRAIRLDSWRFAALSGLAIAVAALLRSSQLLLLPCALWVVARLAPSGPSRWRLGSALLIVTTVCLAPILIRQGLASNRFVPLTANGGMNLWIGNHPGATGGYTSAPFLGSSRGGDFQHTLIVERDRFLAEAGRRSGLRVLSLAEADAFWWREGSRFILTAPAEWLRILTQKCRLALNDYESRTNASIDFVASISPPLRYNPVRFGVLLVLAVSGAVQARRPRAQRAGWLLGALIAPPLLTCLVFFVSGEYRHAAAPALAALAAFGLSRLPLVRETWRERVRADWPRAVFVLGAMVLAFSPTRRIGPAQDRKAYAEALAMPDGGSAPTIERYSLARKLLARHESTLEDRILSTEASLLVESNQAIQFRDRAAAERLIQASRSLQREVLRPGVPFDLATIDRIRANSIRRAVQLCRQPFVRQWPSIERDLVLLGCRPYEEASSSRQTELRNGPGDEARPDALDRQMLARFSPQAMLDFYSAQVARDQKPQTSHYLMALALEKMGRDDDCLVELGRTLEIDPAHELSQRAWGLVLERRGDMQPALQHLLEAIRIHPEYRDALEDAARVAERLGRGSDAKAWRARARSANPDTPRRFVYWARYLHEHGRDAAALAEVARRLAEAPADTEALELQRVIRAALAADDASGGK